MTYLLFLKNFNLQDWTLETVEKMGLSEDFSTIAAISINLILLLLLSWIAYVIVHKIILTIVKNKIKRSKQKNAKIFIDKKAFDALAHLASGLLFYQLLPVFFNLGSKTLQILRLVTVLYIIIMIMISITRILRSIEYIGQRSAKYEKKPISSYVQVVLIICYLIGGVVIVSFLFNRSPMTIITAFGAGMAIVMLIFKDLILGLVASVQVSVNDMVRVGDWISVHNYNADGEITEINLTSVKVRNWDKTVSNVPTYALVSNGFKNVREMQDVGHRRFLHHLLIDIRSIKEVDDKFIKQLEEKNLFSGELETLKWTKNQNQKEYAFEQTTNNTNLSLFRRYIESYLLKHPGIDNDYMVVRQLQQDGNGLPLEIYAFVKSVSFKPLNLIQSDIFEHLFSIMHHFELVNFQKPAGDDIKYIKPTNPPKK